MRYYVRFQDGKIDSQPIVMSESSTESPNASWGIEQLKLNNMLPCQLSYNPMTEELDYDNPKVYENMVEFLGKPLSEENRKQLFNHEQDKKRQAEYPTTLELIVALWEDFIENRPEASKELQLKRLAIKKKYPKET